MSRKNRKKRNNNATGPRPSAEQTWFSKLLRVWPIIAGSFTLGSLIVASGMYYYTVLRQPTLSMALATTKVEAVEDGTQRIQFDVAVANDGSKTAPQFYWNLMVPEDAVLEAELQTGSKTIAPIKGIFGDGTKWLRFMGNVGSPLHRGVMTLGTLTLHTRPNQVVESLWQIQCCDTLLFPEKAPARDKFGRLRVDTAAVRRWQVIPSTLPQLQ